MTATFIKFKESGAYLFVVQKEEYIPKLKHFRFKAKEANNTEGIKMFPFKISLSAFRVLSLNARVNRITDALLFSLIAFVFILF